MGTKKAAKNSQHPQSRYAGRVAPPLVEGVSRKKRLEISIGVAPKDLVQLHATAQSISETAARVEAAAKAVADHVDPNRKQLHRHIEIRVYDSEGLLISDADHDLTASDRLTWIALGDGITSTITSGVR
jgi:multidrug efflux pump subunit AcrB